MSDSIADLEDRATRALDDMKHIEDQYGSDRSTWPVGQVERYDRQRANVGRLTHEIEDARDSERSRDEKVAALRSLIESGSVVRESGFHAVDVDGASRRRSDPWAAGSGDVLTRTDSATGLAARAQDAVELARGLTPEGREMLSNVITRDDNPGASALVIAATSDHYRTAFEKILRDSTRGHLTWTEAEREAYARVESVRAAMSLTDANGGYLVPFVLDPTVNLTNDGTASFIRQRARVEQTTSKDWNGVTSAGVTAQFLAEGVAASDASPTFARVNIPMFKGAAYLIASYEVAEDTNIASQLGALISDARSRQEATAFTTGNGTTAPEGLITGVVAVTASRVSPTTGGAFGAATEVYKVWNALTPRARQSKSIAWLANNTTLSTIRQWDTAGGSSFWADLNGATPPTLIGAPVFEASDMTATVTTGSSILGAFDLAQFFIVDRIGTTIVEVPMVVDGSGVPTYSKGWAAYWRYGSKMADPNAGRLLRL